MKKIIRILFFCMLLALGVLGNYIYHSWKDEKRQQPSLREKKNVYITSVSGGAMQVFEEGKLREYEMSGSPNGAVLPGVADLVMTNGKITKVSMKPDMIEGKVIVVDKEGLELEAYGRIPFDDNMKAYRLGQSLTMAEFSEIIVGYSNVKFVVAGGKIQCALLAERIQKEDEEEIIRVMLMTDEFAGYAHKDVKITGTKSFTVVDGDCEKTYRRGEKVSVSPKKRARVTVSEGGKLKLLSVKRQNIHPAYRGSMEIRNENKGYYIINELPLEQYLYSVVSSEMPTSYGMEALKAQAVCARSYGKKQIRANKLSRYGAHVDDSVSYQVYNNVAEDRFSRQAVDETKGQAVMSNGKIATTYFYSTSCGSSSSSKDVWYTKEIPYLSENRQEDFSSETKFHAFISGVEESCYDKSAPWYRWTTVLSVSDIQKQLEQHINSRYETNPTYIRVKKGNRFVSERPGEIGAIQKIRVICRGKSGIVTTLEVEGTKKIVRIYSEYNVRLLLAGKQALYKRQDGSEAGGLNLLPSAFFEIVQKKKSFTITGGGFGHGVGMSQCGANAMALAGKNYMEIIQFYYPTTSIELAEH